MQICVYTSVYMVYSVHLYVLAKLRNTHEGRIVFFQPYHGAQTLLEQHSYSFTLKNEHYTTLYTQQFNLDLSEVQQLDVCHVMVALKFKIRHA